MWKSGIHISKSPDDLDCDRGHVVVLRKAFTERLDRLEDRVDDGAWRELAGSFDDLDQASGAELLGIHVHRLRHTVTAEYEQVAGMERVGQLVVRRTQERPEGNPGQLDL